MNCWPTLLLKLEKTRKRIIVRDRLDYGDKTGG
ncbi:hypothetical protein T11_8964 [Trichinella zimbabwensis]|uniref:Uncharacterized protein n=1 Tax=Trichinella zimbabwensis TaxID=268475 RepID=A0A0V1FAE5_9BILA|nr:hypothetical protein T11_8964 [Trichinella zimbabwensis]